MAELQQIAYRDAGPSLRREIADVQARAYGPASDHSEAGTAQLHNPVFEAVSFLLRIGGRLVSYAGVVTTTIDADGEPFLASGLSCVATDPEFARRGYASRLVSASTRFIAASGVDLGVFTCAPELARLYTVAGDWQVEPRVVLIGSRDLSALTSTTLDVVVLMRLFSPRAIERARNLRNGTINLNLPVGEFW